MMRAKKEKKNRIQRRKIRKERQIKQGKGKGKYGCNQFL